MRRTFIVLGICALCMGALTTGARAQISIARDNNMLMDVSLRDADLVQVLTALFNTTDGKYQVTIKPGVVGRIARLQLPATPFEKALDAILGMDYSYQKKLLRDGSYLYTISGRQTGAVADFTPIASAATNQAPPTIGMPPLTSDDGNSNQTYSPSYSTTTGGTSTSSTASTDSSYVPFTFTNKPTTGSDTAGAPASDESWIVKLVVINYADVEILSQYLGGTVVDLTPFTTGDTETGTGGNGTRSSGANRSSGSNRSNRNTNNNSGYTGNTTTNTNNTSRTSTRPERTTTRTTTNNTTRK